PLLPLNLHPFPTRRSSDLHARERLQIMRGDATHRGLFTSDLSVNEFLLVAEAGFDPVGLVVGSSIYHIGYQQASWGQNQEMNVLDRKSTRLNSSHGSISYA